jgi:hypothetical protein
MWEDGYGPRSEVMDDVYPRPVGGRTAVVVLSLLASVFLYWLGQRTGVGYLGIASIGLSAITILFLYLRWWFWKLTIHRIVKQADEDRTPWNPDVWFGLAERKPPGLKELGSIQVREGHDEYFYDDYQRPAAEF